MSEEPKPCPFCGSQASPATDHVVRSWWVECDECVGGCGATCGEHATETQAITAWNTRAADAELATLREQNEALREAASIAAEELECFVDFAVRQCEFEGDEVAGYEAVNALRSALAQVAK